MDGASDPGAPISTDLRATLGAAGLRLTRQRVAVYDMLLGADHHPTAEEVYRRVKSDVPTISLATVYKSLEALVGSGLVSKLLGDGGSARYDGRGDHHYHLRCLRSGTVEDLATRYDADLIAKIDPDLGPRLRHRGFRVTGYRLELIGYFEEPPLLRAEGAGAEGDDQP